VAHLLEGKSSKFEPKTEVRMFVGCPKGTKDALFHSPKDMNVFVYTNVKFLEDDYVSNYKSKSKVVLDEISDLSGDVVVV
jgi:hypothetical protein